MSPPSDPRPTRRRLLETVLGLSTVGLAGCPSRGGSGGSTTGDPSETEPPPSPEPSPSPTPSPSSPVPLPPDDFYIENRDGRRHCIDVTVSTEERTVVNGSYEVLSHSGIEFRKVGEQDTEYTVAARLIGGDSLETGWGVGGCREDFPELDGGGYGTDGGVIVENGSLSFTQNECDYAAVGIQSTYLSPEDIGSCAEPTVSPQSVTTISPSWTSTG